MNAINFSTASTGCSRASRRSRASFCSSSPSCTAIRSLRSSSSGWPARRSAFFPSTSIRRGSFSATQDRCSSATCLRPSRSSARAKPRLRFSVVVPLLVLAFPVLDTAAAIVRRARGQAHYRSGSRALPPPADLSLRTQRAPSGAAALRGLLRARARSRWRSRVSSRTSFVHAT